MEDIRDIGTKFEARKIGMRHTKDGHIFYMACHPNDTPADLMQDPLGQRYLIVAVRLDDEDKPVASPSEQEGRRAIKLAGTLCHDGEFQMWMVTEGYAEEPTEEAVTKAMRDYLGVTSRKELKTNSEARKRLVALRDRFAAQWRR